ncbi:MAG: RyR domain-containing protein [Gemmatimonadales bacterium]
MGVRPVGSDLQPGARGGRGSRDARPRHPQHLCADPPAAGPHPRAKPIAGHLGRVTRRIQGVQRQQADHIRVKLEAIGCESAPRPDWAAALFKFSSSEVEELARLEHRRFVEERLAQGWRYAPGSKNAVKKTNPTLIPWEQLSEADREIDRQAIRELPAFLARAGSTIQRTGTHGGVPV